MTTETRSDRTVAGAPARGEGVHPQGDVIRTATGPGMASRLDRLAPDAVPADVGLRRRYADYRRTQGAELLALLPRAGVRSLYGAALAEGAVDGAGEVDPGADTLGALADYCATRLPLPPYEVWRADFEANRTAYLEVGQSQLPTGPVTVDVRAFEDASGRTWYASLDLRQDADAGGFRGCIAFHTGGGSRHYTTAEVFRGDGADAVKDRFAGFDDATLRAFLRSVLP